jgi:hypothetical protein
MIGIVTTSIFDMPALDDYADSVVRFGREERVCFYLIPDRKTDAKLIQRVQNAGRKGLKVIYPSVDEQNRFLENIGIGSDFIPYDSDNRRNVGYLMALVDGAEIVISIDDDNFCTHGRDYVGEHLTALTGGLSERMFLSSNVGWVNVMDFLDYEPKIKVWPRGFPYYARRPASYNRQNESLQAGRIAVHAGLWTADPDVDAVSRLAIQRVVRGAAYDCSNVIAQQTWMPINTQNTSLIREAVKAYYYIRMGYSFGQLRLDRFGDILSGYFCQACVKSNGDYVSFGTPIVDHKRTKHDLLKDLGQEYFGILLVEEMLPWLTELKLTGTTYTETYRCLADEILMFAESHSGARWRSPMSDFLIETASYMKQWTKIVERI